MMTAKSVRLWLICYVRAFFLQNPPEVLVCCVISLYPLSTIKVLCNCRIEIYIFSRIFRKDAITRLLISWRKISCNSTCIFYSSLAFPQDIPRDVADAAIGGDNNMGPNPNNLPGMMGPMAPWGPMMGMDPNMMMGPMGYNQVRCMTIQR